MHAYIAAPELIVTSRLAEEIGVSSDRDLTVGIGMGVDGSCGPPLLGTGMESSNTRWICSSREAMVQKGLSFMPKEVLNSSIWSFTTW